MQNYTYKTIFINDGTYSYYANIIKHSHLTGGGGRREGEIKVMIEID